MRTLVITGIVLICAAGFVAGQKRKKEESTQVLALPKDPPLVAIGETNRLVFHVTPLSAKGLLSAQTRDALKALLKLNGGAQVIHLRAFVAGSGDMRRVPQIVSEVLQEKHQELPSVSVVQGGSLGLTGAQVVFEAVSAGRKELNRSGLRFASGHVFAAPDPQSGVLPLMEKSLTALAADLQGGEALRVTCLVSNEDPDELVAIAKHFPGAAADVVQTQRAPVQAFASCDGVGRGGPVTAPRLAFTGTQIAFGPEEKDAVLAFQRFDAQLAASGAGTGDVVNTNLYPLGSRVVELVRKVRAAWVPTQVVPFEGLASMDGSFAVDAVVAVR